jgi:hypothetical protein
MKVRQFFPSRPVVAAVASAAALCASVPAPAQFGLDGGYQDAFRPGYTSRDVQLAVEALKLDQAQRFIVETLYEDYTEEFQTGIDSFRQSVGEMQSMIGTNPDPQQVMRIVFGAMEEWRVESRQLADRFLTDMKGLLNEQQAALWPAFERRLYRMKYLSDGRLSGENLDLIAVIDELDLGAHKAQIQALLDEYEVRLDDALRRREKYVHDSQAQLMQAVQEGKSDLAEDVAERRIQYRVGVRDVNEYYTTAIAEALPPDAAHQLVQVVRERTHPRIFRKTEVERIFEAARKLEGIEPQTLQAVEGLEQQYLGELGAFNDRLLAVARDYQPAEMLAKSRSATSRLQGQKAQRPEDPLRDELTKRREMGNKYIEQLKALLSPEQFASLPGARRWTLPAEQGNLILGDEGPAIAGQEGGRAAKMRRLLGPDATPASDDPPKEAPGVEPSGDKEGGPDD